MMFPITHPPMECLPMGGQYIPQFEELLLLSRGRAGGSLYVCKRNLPMQRKERHDSC
ncbi:Recombination protein RecR (fragment) [Verrucomicrobia bacterium]